MEIARDKPKKDRYRSNFFRIIQKFSECVEKVPPRTPIVHLTFFYGGVIIENTGSQRGGGEGIEMS